MYKLLELDRNTWNHTSVQIICFRLEHLKPYKCVQTNEHSQPKSAMEYWI